MPRRSSTWRSEHRCAHRALLVLLAGLAATVPRPAAAAPRWCLPGLFEEGARLHPIPAPEVFWLDPLLRQHVLCRHARDRPQEQRVLVLGSSGPFGYPLPASQAAPAELDRLLVADGLPARAFNLGFVNTYQLRDAFIARAALAYDPAVIVYPLTIAEFQHVAPAVYPPLIEFFKDNAGALEALVSNPLPGLVDPILRYGLWLSGIPRTDLVTARLRQVGAVSRALVRAVGEDGIRRATGRFDGPPPPTLQPMPSYDCAATLAAEEKDRAWRTWDILAYLEELQRTRGIDVVVVHWPLNHQPSGACYDQRVSDARLAQFLEWLKADTAERGLAYVDLHDLLRPDEFLDSLHLTAEGNRRVAAALAPAVENVVRRRMAR
jgi:hypothetical protein